VGRTSDLHRLSDFAGTYAAAGLGGAWVGGTGRIELKNDKGVTMTLEGSRIGLEFADNLSGISIVFEQPVH
jgi:hypothetical protein